MTKDITGDVVVVWDLEPTDNPRLIEKFFATPTRSGGVKFKGDAWVLYGATQYAPLTLTKYCGNDKMVHAVPGDYSADAPQDVPATVWEFATAQAHVRECPGRSECIVCC